MSHSNHTRLATKNLRGRLPRPRKKKFALLLSNRQMHRLCRRMLRSFE